MTFRAADRTAVAALNFFFFFVRLTMIGLEHCIARIQSNGSEPSMEERDFFDERPETRVANLTCPHCRQAADYELGWLVRRKKKSLSGRADERDRARFAKARSYMVRRDDMVACKNVRCRKRFEVSGVQSVAFLD